MQQNAICAMTNNIRTQTHNILSRQPESRGRQAAAVQSAADHRDHDDTALARLLIWGKDAAAGQCQSGYTMSLPAGYIHSCLCVVMLASVMNVRPSPFLSQVTPALLYLVLAIAH